MRESVYSLKSVFPLKCLYVLESLCPLKALCPWTALVFVPAEVVFVSVDCRGLDVFI